MKFLRESELPERPDDVVFRTSRMSHLIAGIFLCGFAAGAVWLLAAPQRSPTVKSADRVSAAFTKAGRDDRCMRE
jgi:hypothetical protein